MRQGALCIFHFLPDVLKGYFPGLQVDPGESCADCFESDGFRFGWNWTKSCLLSTFIEGDRYIHQEYLDSIGLFHHFGHPYMLLTMTCNPQWGELQKLERR